MILLTEKRSYRDSEHGGGSPGLKSVFHQSRNSTHGSVKKEREITTIKRIGMSLHKAQGEKLAFGH